MDRRDQMFMFPSFVRLLSKLKKRTQFYESTMQKLDLRL